MSYPVLGQLYNNTAQYISVDVSQTGHGFTLLTPVYLATDNTWKNASNRSLSTLATHVAFQPTANTFIAVSKGRIKQFQHGLGPASTKFYLANQTLSTVAVGIYSQQIAIVLDSNHIQVSIHQFGLGELAPRLTNNELLVHDGVDLTTLAMPANPARHVLMADSAETHGVKWVANNANAPDRVLKSTVFHNVNAADARHIKLDTMMNAAAEAHVEVFEATENPSAITLSDPWGLCTNFTPTDYGNSITANPQITASDNVGEIEIAASGFNSSFVGMDIQETAASGSATILEVYNNGLVKAVVNRPFTSTDYTASSVNDLVCDATRTTLSGYNNAKKDAWEYQTRTYVGSMQVSPPNMFVDSQTSTKGFKGLAAVAYLDAGNLIFSWSLSGAVSCCGVGGSTGAVNTSTVWRQQVVNGDGSNSNTSNTASGNPELFDLEDPRVVIDNNSNAHVIVKGALSAGGTKRFLHLISSVSEQLYVIWTLVSTDPAALLATPTLYDHRIAPDIKGMLHCYFIALVGADRDVYHSAYSHITQAWPIAVKITRGAQLLNNTITDVPAGLTLSLDTQDSIIILGFHAINSATGADVHTFVATSIDYGNNYTDITHIDTTAVTNSSNVKVLQRSQLHVLWVGQTAGDMVDQLYYRRIASSGAGPITKVSNATQAVTGCALAVHNVNNHVIWNESGNLRYAAKTFNPAGAPIWTIGGLGGEASSYLFREQQIPAAATLAAHVIGEQFLVGVESDTALLTAVNQLGTYQWRRSDNALINDSAASSTTYDSFEDPYVLEEDYFRHIAYVKQQAASPNYTLGYQVENSNALDITLHADFAAHNQRLPLMAIEPSTTAGVASTVHVVWTGLTDDDAGTLAFDESLVSHLYYTNLTAGVWSATKNTVTSTIADWDTVAQSTQHADFKYVPLHSKCVLITSAVTESNANSKIYYLDVQPPSTTFSTPVRVDNLAYFDTLNCTTAKFLVIGTKYYVIFYCVEDGQYYQSASTDVGASWTVLNSGNPTPVFDVNYCHGGNLSIDTSSGLIYAVCSGGTSSAFAPEIHFARGNGTTWTHQKAISPTRHDVGLNGPSDYYNPVIKVNGEYPASLKNQLLLAYTQGVSLAANPVIIAARSNSNGLQWITSRIPAGEFKLITIRPTLVNQRSALQISVANRHPRLYVAGKALGTDRSQLYGMDISKHSDTTQLVSLAGVSGTLPYDMVSDRNARESSTHAHVNSRHPLLHVAYADGVGLKLGHMVDDVISDVVTLSTLPTTYVHCWTFADALTQNIVVSVTAVHNSSGNMTIAYYECEVNSLSNSGNNGKVVIRSATVYTEPSSDTVFCDRLRHVATGSSKETVHLYASFLRPDRTISKFVFNRNLAMLGNNIALPNRTLRVGWELGDVTERTNTVSVGMYSDHSIAALDTSDGVTYGETNPGSTLSFDITPGHSEYSLAASTQAWRLSATDQFVYAREYGTTAGNTCYIFDSHLKPLTKITLTGVTGASTKDDIAGSANGRVVAVGRSLHDSSRGKIEVFVANDAASSVGVLGGSNSGYFPQLITSPMATITATTTVSEEEGGALAVSEYGTTIVSGVPKYSANTGRILVYEVSNGAAGNPLWQGTVSNFTAELGASTPTAYTGAFIGTNVCIGGTGNGQFVATCVHQGSHGGAYTGAVLIWVRGASWTDRTSPDFTLDITGSPGDSLKGLDYGINCVSDSDGTNGIIVVSGEDSVASKIHYVYENGGNWADVTTPSATIRTTGGATNEVMPVISSNKYRIHTRDGNTSYVYLKPGALWTGTVNSSQTITHEQTTVGSYAVNSFNIYAVNNATAGTGAHFSRHLFKQTNGCIADLSMTSSSTVSYMSVSSSEPQSSALCSLFTRNGYWSFTPVMIARNARSYPEIQSSSLDVDSGYLLASYQGVVSRTHTSNINIWRDVSNVGKPISFALTNSDVGIKDAVNSWKLDDVMDFNAWSGGSPDTTLMACTDDHVLVADPTLQSARIYKRVCGKLRQVLGTNLAGIIGVELNDDRMFLLTATLIYVYERTLPNEWGYGWNVPIGWFSTIAVTSPYPSIKLSTDGSTLVIGSNPDANGGFYVYEVAAGGSFAAATLTHTRIGTGGNNEGQQLDVSSDGSVIVAGSSTLQGANVFLRPGASWTSSVPLTTLTTGAGVNEGSAVAISDDGTRIVIGDSGANAGAGSVHIYDRNNRVFDPNVTLVRSISVSTNENEGSSLGLSADGSSLLSIGAGGNTTARIYSLNSSVFTLNNSSVHTLLENAAGAKTSYRGCISRNGNVCFTLSNSYLRSYSRHVPLLVTSSKSKEVALYAKRALDSSASPAMLYLERRKYWTGHPTALTAAVDTNDIDIANWSALDTFAATVQENSQTLYLVIGLYDSDTPNTVDWYIAHSTNGARRIARQHSSNGRIIYQYNSNITYSGETFTESVAVVSTHFSDAITGTSQQLLANAMSVSSNQMTAAQLNAATSANFPSLDRYDKMILGVVMQSADTNVTPVLESLDVSFNSNVTYVLSNDYTIDLHGTNSVVITAPSTLTSSKTIRVLVVR
jgi:hypothetical protein